MKKKEKIVQTVSKKQILFAWLVLIVLILSIFGLIYVKIFQTNIDNIDKQSNSEIFNDKELEELVNKFNNSKLLEQYKNDGINMVAIFDKKHFTLEVSEAANTNIYNFEVNYPELSCVILPDSMEEFDLVFEILLYENQKRLGNTKNIDNYVDGILDGNLNVIGFNKVVADELVFYSMDISRIMGDEEIK